MMTENDLDRRIREYREEFARFRAEAARRGGGATKALQTRLAELELRALEAEKRAADFNVFENAGERMSRELDTNVRHIGDSLRDLWRDLKRHGHDESEEESGEHGA